MSARSAGSRSIDEAPKKPQTPVVRSSTYAASCGSAIGPPWHSTRMPGRTPSAASRIACTRPTHSSSVSAVRAPIVPDVVSPMCGTRTSAPARAIAAACSASKTYGQVTRPRSAASRIISTSRSKPMPVSSRFCRNTPSISPTVGKFCTPANPRADSSSRKSRHDPKRIGSADARQHGGLPHDGQHLRGHLGHDRVRVAVGHQPGQRAAPGHPVPARVVDDDQVGPARLGALGRQAGPGARADDGLAAVRLGPQPGQQLVSPHVSSRPGSSDAAGRPSPGRTPGR